MPKYIGSFFGRIKGRKLSFVGRIFSNFEFKKVICCLYHSGTVRHSTVKLKDYTNSVLKLVPVIVPLKIINQKGGALSIYQKLTPKYSSRVSLIYN